VPVQKLPILLTPDKSFLATNQRNQQVAWRNLERWASVIQIAYGGASGYASLTGPGQTATPGDLTQAGGFTVTAPSTSTMGIVLTDNSSNGIRLRSMGTGNIQLFTGNNVIVNPGGGIQLNAGSPIFGGTLTTGRIVVGCSERLDLSGDTGLRLMSQVGGAHATASGIVIQSGVNSGGYVVQNAAVTIVGLETVQLVYGFNTASGANTAANNVQIHNGSDGSNATVHLFVHGGSPAGVITPAGKGDICFDTGTPGLWISTDGTTWTMYTLP